MAQAPSSRVCVFMCVWGRVRGEQRGWRMEEEVATKERSLLEGSGDQAGPTFQITILIQASGGEVRKSGFCFSAQGVRPLDSDSLTRPTALSCMPDGTG